MLNITYREKNKHLGRTKDKGLNKSQDGNGPGHIMLAEYEITGGHPVSPPSVGGGGGGGGGDNDETLVRL